MPRYIQDAQEQQKIQTGQRVILAEIRNEQLTAKGLGNDAINALEDKIGQLTLMWKDD